MIIKRELIEEIKLFLKRREFIAIVGPRQAGKTTFLQLITEYLIKDLKVDKQLIKIITFEDRMLLSQFESDAVAFVKSYFPQDTKNKRYLMIDEFQYVKEGGQRLKLIYDTISNLKIIITGSSSLDLKAQVGKYLVGRVLTFYLYPFDFTEVLRAKDKRLEPLYIEKNKEIIKWLLEQKGSIKSKTGVDIFASELIKHYEQYCTWGGFPAVVLSRIAKERQKILGDIYSNYILKDIKGLLELATDKNLFLLCQYLSTQLGGITNYQNLGMVSGLTYRQLKRHLNILKETFIISEVKPFFKNKQKELSKNPKIYFLDLGFRNNIIGNMNEFNKRTDMGAIIENAAFIRLKQLLAENGKINFWRTKIGTEVDFVIQIKGEVIPLEVKFQTFKQQKVTRSLMSFINAFKPKKAVVLTRDFWGRIKKQNCDILFAPVCYL